MKNFRPDKLVQQRRSDWLRLGGKLATTIKQDAEKGISQDPDGKPFPPYKESYAIKKAAGKASPVGADRQISPPNLRLTGTMLGSISPQKATKDSVEIIYRDGLKVLGNANPPARLKKGKRNIFGLNDKNWGHARDFIDDEIDQKILKFNRKKVFFDIKV